MNALRPSVQWIRLLSALTAGLLSCVFAQYYSMFSNLTVEHTWGLPQFTDVAFRVSRYAYLMPVLLFLLGILFLRKRDKGEIGFECTISLAWLLALFWALFVICVWVLPKIEISHGMP